MPFASARQHSRSPASVTTIVPLSTPPTIRARNMFELPMNSATKAVAGRS